MAALVVRDWPTAAEALSHLPELASVELEGAGDGGLELRLLASAMKLTKIKAPDGAKHTSQMGYVLLGQPDEEGQVLAWPALAVALAQGRTGEAVAKEFADLWLVDHHVWSSLNAGDPVEQIAESWLQSPGRRLLFDLRVLDPDADLPGTEHTVVRLLQAAGIPEHLEPDLSKWSDAGLIPWRTLHWAIPGVIQARWKPEDPDSVIAAFHALDEGGPLERGAAIGWLMKRAFHSRAYRVGGISGNLRADLPLRLAAAFESPTSDQLDLALLRISSRWTTQLDQPVRTAWGLARWLRALLTRNPFSGCHAEVLIKRLSAFAPKDPKSESIDVLDPQWVESLADVAFISAVAAHYHSAEALWPTPGPIADRLHDLSVLETQSAGDDLGDELGWLKLARHADVIWAARHLCTDLKLDWLETPEIVNSALDLLADQPNQDWIAEAIFREKSRLPVDTDVLIARRWEALPILKKTGPLLASIAGKKLSKKQQKQALQAALTAEVDWRPWLLSEVITAFEDTAKVGLDALLDLLDEPSDQVKIDAALVTARQFRVLAESQRTRFLSRLQAPLFRNNVGLRRELRRLGIPR